MARKRTVLAPEVEREIVLRTERGESSKTIYAAIGGVISEQTIRRRAAEIKAGRAPRRTVAAPAPASEPPAPPEPQAPASVTDVPDEVPEGAPIEDIEAWLVKLQRASQAAEEDHNWSAVASIAQKVSTLMGLRHRMRPVPKEDPNTAPDMIALADQGEALLMQLARDAFKGTR